MCNIQIPFHKISLEDMEWYKKKEKEVSIEACDSPFASIFSWASKYDTEMGLVCGCAVTRYRTVWGMMYAYPIGGTADNRRQCVAELAGIAEREGHPLKFIVLTESNREELEKYFPGMFEIDDNRDRYDYVYETERLAQLKGKKLAGKRNHIHRFEDGGEWKYEEITEDNIAECLEMMKKWISEREQDEKFADDSMAREELDEERAALETSFAHYFEFGLRGGLIRRAGNVIAFTAGEQLNSDTFVTHYEKALPDYPGTYQVINQQLARSLESEFRYINREDDAGDLGLRKSKLSYYPDKMVKKFIAVQSNVTYAGENDFEDICRIWNEAFGDSTEYVRFYLKNRFTPDNMLTVRRDGHVAGMISFWHARLKVWDSEKNVLISQPVMYAYAVATDRKYRRQGIAAEIMAHAAEKYSVPIVLEPINDDVRAYYRKLGFQDYFAGFEYETDIKNNGEMPDAEIISDIEKLDTADYVQRREICRDSAYVSWDEEAVRYAALETRFCGGRIAKTGDDYVMYYVKDGKMMVSEYTGDKEHLEISLKAAAAAEHLDSISYVNGGGMILWNGHECDALKAQSGRAYLGLSIG